MSIVCFMCAKIQIIFYIYKFLFLFLLLKLFLPSILHPLYSLFIGSFKKAVFWFDFVNIQPGYHQYYQHFSMTPNRIRKQPLIHCISNRCHSPSSLINIFYHMALYRISGTLICLLNLLSILFFCDSKKTCIFAIKTNLLLIILKHYNYV